MTRIQANLCLLFAGAIWGGGFIMQTFAMATLQPLWYIGLRFVLATLIILPFAIAETRKIGRPVSKREAIAFSAIGLSLFAGAMTQQIGLLSTTVTNSGFLTGLYVIFVPVLSVILLRKAPHWIIWPAALMALGGIFLLSGGSLATLSHGDIMTIVCAFFFAIQVLLIGVFAASSGRPLLLSAWQFAITAVAALIAAAFIEPVSIAGIRGAMMPIIYSGIFSSGVAFSLQVIGQRYTSPSQAAIFLSSEALFAASFGAIFLGETIAPVGYIGCAIIFLAMIMVELVPEILSKRVPAQVQ